jgi:hypothetical protein
VTVTARHPVPSEGSAFVTGQLATTPLEALTPDQVPFWVRLLHPLSRVRQGAGVEVGVTVGVRVAVKVAVGDPRVGVAVGEVDAKSP